MKLIPLYLIIGFVLTAQAQEKQIEDMKSPLQCDTAIKDLLPIRKITLRMTKNDFYQLVGRQQYSRFLSSDDLRNLPEFHGIEGLTVNFYKDRLSFLNIKYSSDVKWESAREFLAVVAPQINLPLTGWEPDGDVIISNLVCKDFKATIIALNSQAEITLQDTVAEYNASEEQRKIDEQKKKVFKP